MRKRTYRKINLINDDKLQQLMKEMSENKIAITINTIKNYCSDNLYKYDEFIFENDCLLLQYSKQHLPLNSEFNVSQIEIIYYFHQKIKEITNSIPKEFIFFLEEIGYQLVTFLSFPRRASL